ncbi:4-hydroxy-tetrahydrodipicolinate synthase [Enterococcus sp. 7E2_DIV0204]|uniref:4-hydroxy-tetrahydrodipicolinate synthase n=1 Tax=Candidatus Enterococcus lemimoniae TaxID=1834167 RepID=A0ABZ2T1B8_9ENTE|nr:MULTISPECIES: 4-hydroxy-tetrahydrodipicolinate synthase [unclassified Enterococcus]OTN86405.1 4-hydroxy-tetrahydrodipicolinate synthase [Enterococcus sp. 7E2_DIV0204]OTO69629.1 4-hydroxy-tetrahydrodipicolinate synthase [Enterococcus sp. 12C11_DIV0727]OTP48402.1 4-hydroxy-tetrahydrodipicolinate synthase [Enterococcus sp. 7D2_DIV0200]
MNLENATIITAMVTPFDESGAIDFAKLPQLVDHLLDHHTEGIILAGTTGESPTLTHDEEIELFNEVIRLVDGRVPIICGVGTNDTRDSVEFVQEISAIRGIDAGLAVVPYYNKPNQEGLYQHFKAIAEASDLPIILYNVPGRTVASLDVATTLRLAELDNIIAIKECFGLDALTELVEKAPKDFLVYTGEDSLAFSIKAIGGQGVISVASHVFGTEMYDMFQALDHGEIKKAASIQRQLLPKMNALFSVPSPAPVKAVLNQMGISVGDLRLPLVPCTSEEKAKILSILDL